MLPNRKPIPVPGQPSLENRRRHGRVRCDGVTCDLGEVVNISASGMQVNTGRVKVPVNADIRFRLHGPDGPFDVRAMVLHSRKAGRGYEVGLQFHSLTREAMRHLATLARIGATKHEVFKD